MILRLLEWRNRNYVDPRPEWEQRMDEVRGEAVMDAFKRDPSFRNLWKILKWIRGK